MGRCFINLAMEMMALDSAFRPQRHKLSDKHSTEIIESEPLDSPIFGGRRFVVLRQRSGDMTNLTERLDLARTARYWRLGRLLPLNFTDSSLQFLKHSLCSIRSLSIHPAIGTHLAGSNSR
jgi:hypothetical protein